MNYELAKELKDAGFPQIPQHNFLCPENGKEEDCVTAPTLSELIEACGDGLIAIQRSDTAGWEAVSDWVEYYPPEVKFGAKGKTPEIAVARLYLELNK